MTHPTDRTWTLDELVAEAAGWVARVGVGVADGRVREAPDARTIRYYQQLGLVDRPVRYDGRKALYGRRSLIQAVAVKLLQSEGRSLPQIQRAFASQPFDAFERAVLDAVGEVPSTPAPAPMPVALRVWELAPGVTLTVDPSVQPDPEGLARTLFHALTQGGLS